MLPFTGPFSFFCQWKIVCYSHLCRGTLKLILRIVKKISYTNVLQFESKDLSWCQNKPCQIFFSANITLSRKTPIIYRNQSPCVRMELDIWYLCSTLNFLVKNFICSLFFYQFQDVLQKYVTQH